MVIAICDDEKILRNLLSDYCLRYGKEHNLKINIIEFSNGEEIINYDSCIDLLLLEINLPGMSGIEVKNALIKKDNLNFIIFVSGITNRIYDAFSSKTLGFITKPFQYEDLCRSLEDYKKTVDSFTTIEIPAEGGITSINVNRIIYVKAQNIYSEIITQNGSYLIRSSLNELENRLGNHLFFRIHKSHLINMEYIKSIDGYDAILDNGTKLKIGRTKLANLKNEYCAYCRKNAH